MTHKKILFIEDDELDVISVQRSLKKLDIAHLLYTAYNGKEALDMLNHPDNPLKPDVILLDLNMPKMNGLEFLKSIRQDANTKDIKVFVMTTSGESSDRKKADEFGVSGYIIKPLSYDDNNKRMDSMDAFVQFHLRKILNES